MKQREVRTLGAARASRSTTWGGWRAPSRARHRVGAGALALVIVLGIGAAPVLAGTSGSSPSPALRAQARKLYSPAQRYEHSTTSAERARSHSAGRRIGRVIDACQAPYLTRLLSRREAKLDMLWNHATLLETYEAEVKPVATQLATLAASWAALSLRNRAMNEFVHGVAAEFRATLDAAPSHSCGFVKAIAAHHFSYAWAEQSSYGRRAAQWWKKMSRAGNRTDLFWSYVCPACSGRPPSSTPGAHLFTNAQLVVLSNLPGELS